MAEENADAVAEEGAEGEKKPGKKKLIIIIAAVLLVGILGGVGAMFLLGGGEEEVAAEPEPETPTQALYTKIRTLEGSPYFTVVVPSNDGRTHYMQVYVETKSRDEAVVAALTLHMPKIVSNLNRLFSSQSFEKLRTIEGKMMMQQSATQEIQKVMQEKIGKPGIEKVLFTGFIMQ